MKGCKTLILLETEAQVRDCLTWLDHVDGERRIIALTPFAIYELDKKNIPYKRIEDYYYSNEPYKLGMENYKKVEDFCRFIDGFISKKKKKLKKYGITPAFFSIYYLKIIYDTLTIKLFQLNRLVKLEKPDIVIVYEGKKFPFGAVENAPYIFFDNRESIYSQLLSLDGWRTKIIKKPHLNESSDYDPKKEKIDLLKMSKIWLSKNPLLFHFAVVLVKDGMNGMLKYIKNIFHFNKKMTPIAIFGSGYNWNDCFEVLLDSGFVPIYRISEDFLWLNKSLKKDSKAMDMVWIELKNEIESKDFFKYDSINFFSILASRIQFMIEKITMECIFAYEDITRLIVTTKIKALVSSTFSTPSGHSISRAVRNAGIHVITWQHGGYGQFEHPFLRYTELMSSDVHYIFGDGVRKYLEQPANAFKTDLITIGSSSLGKLNHDRFDNQPSQRKVILYIVSASSQNCLYISTFPFSSDNLYWDTQIAIINILGKHKDFNVIIKQHPNETFKDIPIRSYVKDKGFENFTFIRNEKSVVELISIADIIIIDIPCTTPLQAMTTSKPMFVYLGHLYYDEEACDLLGRRAMYSKDISNFIDMLAKYLSNGVYGADVNNKDFLIYYGTASLEISPGMRAAKALKQVINESIKL